MINNEKWCSYQPGQYSIFSDYAGNKVRTQTASWCSIYIWRNIDESVILNNALNSIENSINNEPKPEKNVIKREVIKIISKLLLKNKLKGRN